MPSSSGCIVIKLLNFCPGVTIMSCTKIVHFDTGAEGDYVAHVTFFARAKRVQKVT